MQPFGQVPILEEDGVTIFESGAIVLHIGERSEVLLPKDPAARARAVQWLIAALNSIEPHIMSVAVLMFYEGQEWAKLRRPSAEEFALRRLGALAANLGDKPYLDGETFTAGDLMMTTVLRIMPELVVDERLKAYVERCTARPAFQRALDAQMGDFRPRRGGSGGQASEGRSWPRPLARKRRERRVRLGLVPEGDTDDRLSCSGR